LAPSRVTVKSGAVTPSMGVAHFKMVCAAAEVLVKATSTTTSSSCASVVRAGVILT